MLAIFILSIIFSTNVLKAQVPLQAEYTVLGLSVEGNQVVGAESILGLTGIYPGDKIVYPGDDKFQTAIRNLWKRNQFRDIRIVADRVTVDGIFLKVIVKEFPRLYKVNITGNDKLKEKDILMAVAKSRGDIIKPYDLNLIKKQIKKAYMEEDLQFTKVEAELSSADTSNYADLNITIDEGVKFYAKSVEFIGNTHYTDSKLASVFDDTHTKAWWQFWRSAKFNPDKYEEDKKLLEAFYKKNGFMNFKILKDTLAFDENKGDVVVQVTVDEGEQYYLRNVIFKGNTIYRQENFMPRLDMKKGDLLNLEKFEFNLLGNQDQTDVLAVYMDNGYLQANMRPEYKVVGKDSVDVEITVTEGERFKIGRVEITGNTKTKDKVIRRELYTRPGDYFNRSSVINSIRALGATNFFNPEALKPDVQPSRVDKNTVDLVYNVEEKSNDQASLQLGFAGSYGLTLSLNFIFNNFCISEPFQAGAGQTVNLSAEVGQSDRYRNFVIGFMEPWLFDKPTTLGFNIYHSMYNYETWQMYKTGGIANIGRRFRWPDNYFRGDWSWRSQYTDNQLSSPYYREGKYWEHSISQTFSRANLNNMFFPSSGSSFSLSTSWAMGSIGIGNTDFFKNELRYMFATPLFTYKGSDKVVLFLESRLGYVTGLKSDSSMSASDLFYMGGNGMGMFGVIPLRGYDDNSIGTYWDVETQRAYQGDKVAMKATAELRFLITPQDPMPIYVYFFAEAGNLWRDIKSTNPATLKRSAGIGLQIMVPMLGNIGFSWGYGFDASAVPSYNGLTYSPIPPGWKFLFHLGGL